MSADVSATLRLLVQEEVSSKFKAAAKEMEAFQKRTNSVRGEVQDFFGAFNVPIGRLGAGAALGYIAFQSIKAADALAESKREPERCSRVLPSGIC